MGLKTIRLNVTSEAAQLIEELPEIIKKVTLEELESATAAMVEIAKFYCPVDTGSLQKSIRRRRTSEGLTVTAGGYVVNPKTRKTVNYAAIVEARQPFLLPAWLTVKAGIEERIQERVADECSGRS